MARTAAARGLPPIPHVDPASRRVEVMYATEMFVAASQSPAAVFQGEQIQRLVPGKRVPIRLNVTVNPEARDASVRIDIEP